MADVLRPVRFGIVMLTMGAFMQSLLLGVIATLVVILAYVVFKRYSIPQHPCPVCAEAMELSSNAQFYICTDHGWICPDCECSMKWSNEDGMFICSNCGATSAR